MRKEFRLDPGLILIAVLAVTSLCFVIFGPVHDKCPVWPDNEWQFIPQPISETLFRVCGKPKLYVIAERDGTLTAPDGRKVRQVPEPAP